MTQTVKALQGDDIIARDGPIGAVDDVVFDDERWAVRYLVVDTGAWLPGKRVLISPASVNPRGVGDDSSVSVALTRDQVRNAPEASSNLEPLEGPMLWGAAVFPFGPPEVKLDAANAHLHSAREIIGCEVRARDGTAGRIDDVAVDDEGWRIEDVIVDTEPWWPGGEARLAPQEVERIDWNAREVHVRLTRDELKQRRKEASP